jgi:biotin carboxylase
MVTRKKILYVIGASGPPFEYVLPKLARYADVYALVFATLRKEHEDEFRRRCKEVTFRRPHREQTDRDSNCSASDDIVSEARRIGASGIITFSEFAVIPVAEACSRLGLPGPGANVRYARDKWLMRSRWAEAGLPQPRFARVASLDDLAAAAGTLRRPFLLKTTGRGGGIGQYVVDTDTSLPEAWKSLDAVLDGASERGFADYCTSFDTSHYVAEEIIESTTESWYDEPGYEDFVSVEGIVSGGEYHPLCITARPPSIPPFTETGALSPCTLPEHLQRKIEDCARRAVTALGLDTCATHTEMKLMPGNELCLLETAARFIGSMGSALAEIVFGIDMISLLAGELLGERQSYPDAMLVSGNGAAGVIFLFAADARGKPWASLPPFHWRAIDWASLVSGQTRVHVMPSLMAPDGNPMPAYYPGKGSLGYAGSIYLTSRDPATLLSDRNRLVNGLESAARAAASRVASESAVDKPGLSVAPG